MRLSDLVGLTADAAFVVGAGQRVLAVNEAARNLIGIPEDQILGRACDELMAPGLPGGQCLCQTIDCPVYDALLRREPVPLPWAEWRTRDGRRIPISGSVIAAPSGEAGGEVALVTIHVRGANATANATLDVRLLGPVALLADGVALPMPPRRRVLELLAYLAFAGPGGAQRDRIAEDFWPDESIDLSAPRLRVLLHGLRQLLTAAGLEPPLRRQGSVYVLDESPLLRVDALEFEARAQAALRAGDGLGSPTVIEDALALYRGDFAAGEDFGAWAATHHRRLRRLYHDLLARAAVAFAVRGAIERSVECCEIALRSDPLQEQFQVALITYYAHLGRRADARRQYEDYRRILASEVGVQPSAAVERAIFEAINSNSVPDDRTDGLLARR